MGRARSDIDLYQEGPARFPPEYFITASINRVRTARRTQGECCYFSQGFTTQNTVNSSNEGSTGWAL